MSLLLLAVLLAGMLSVVLSQTQVSECTFLESSGYTPIQGSGDTLLLRHIIDPTLQTITIELTHVGVAWLGMAFVEQPIMVPSVAVIGIPDTGAVDKYSMTDRSLSGVTLDNTNPLVESNIVQNGTHTTLTFTKALVENGEVSVVSNDANLFIWAIGSSSDALEFHINAGSDSVQFDVCSASAPKSPTSSAPVVAPVGYDNAVVPSPGKAPTSASVSLPVAAPVLAPSPSGGAGSRIAVTNDIDVTITANPSAETVTIEMTYAGQGWVSFGFSSNGGRMVDSTAVIGLPDSSGSSSTNIQKYDMTSKALSGVVAAASNRQTLTDLALQQNDTHTYMKFTKKLLEDNEPPILLNKQNVFIFAVGSSNKLAQHTSRGDFNFVLKPCDSSKGSCNSSADVNNAVPNRTTWIVHGLLMVISWSILIPLGIASSLSRSLFPGTLWFQLHRTFNMIGVLCTIIGFVIAIVTLNSEGGGGIGEMNTHHIIGITVSVLALLQGINGIFRPHLPAPSTKDFKNSDHNDDYDDEPEIDNTPNDSIPSSPAKSNARKIWEIGHRVLGVALVALAWYNCYTGVEEYNERYSGTNYIPVLLGITGVVVIVIVALLITSKFVKKEPRNSS